MARHASWLTAFSLAVSVSASAYRQPTDDSVKRKPKEPGEVELALAAVGHGPADELKRRLFTNRITVISAEMRAQSLAGLPEKLQKNRITQGKLLRRVEAVLARSLELHGRRENNRVELFLFRDDVPFGMLWRGSVLALSDGLAEPLGDAELAGVIAHELGHVYFEDEMAAAKAGQDARAMRLVELKCDAVAIVSLKLLGYEPSFYLRGLRRVQQITRRKSLSSGIFQSHPELHARAELAERLIASLAAEGHRR
jgi:Zn-dependent protease with chaperone function